MSESKQENQSQFDQWAILELMGKGRLGGRVREEHVFGVAMIRIDIPNDQGESQLTRYFHPNALYGLTPVSREVAIAVARYNDRPPVSRYELPAAAAVVEAEEYDFE